MLKKIIDGILAGIMISIGGAVFLGVFSESRIVAAILFTVALLSICFKGYSLFTGKVGFIPEKHGKEEFSVLLLGLLGNAIATILCGFAIKFAIPATESVATEICTGKLTQTIPETFIRAIFCGILMYMAVSIFKDHNKNISGILFCVPVFILAGFEHSIADIFYFATSNIVSLESFLYLWIVILGNAVGGMLLPTLSILGGRKNASK